MFRFAVLFLLSAWAVALPVEFSGPKGVTLTGEWRPVAATPAPAIVLAHGCGGLYDGKGKINARHEGMAKFLNDAGYHVLLVDSLSGRGVKQLCTVKMSERTIKSADRAADMYAALDWLQARTEVDAAHIGLLGWSHGGGTALTAMGRERSGLPRFNAAVAFYPGCSTSAQSRKYQPNNPLLILTGEADDWTPVTPCRALATQFAETAPAIELVIYPETYHDFDNPALKAPRVRREVPNGVNPGQGVTIAPNEKAARDAYARVAAWFERYLR